MTLRCGDCLSLLKELPDNSVDLVVMDPPYEFCSTRGGGAFGTAHRTCHAELEPLSTGYPAEVDDELRRVMKAVNLYVWCSKDQLRRHIDYWLDVPDVTMDLLTWHRTNPVPTCGNKYLSDTDYCLFFREKGVKVYGDYHTKRKYMVSPTNKTDKERYGHPTVKPLEYINNLVYNSSKMGDTVLDPFMGSGTTGVACAQLGREFIGFELDPTYFNTAKKRIETEGKGRMWF